MTDILSWKRPSTKLDPSNRLLSEVPGARIPSGVASPDQFEILKRIDYIPAHGVDHAHSILYIRYLGPLLVFAEAVVRALADAGVDVSVEQVMDTMLDRTGGDEEGLRRQVILACFGSGGAEQAVSSQPVEFQDQVFAKLEREAWSGARVPLPEHDQEWVEPDTEEETVVQTRRLPVVGNPRSEDGYFDA